MKRAASWILGVAVAIVAYAAVRFATEEWTSNRNMQRAALAAKGRLDSIQAEAKKQHPDLPASEGMQKAAGAQMANDLEKHKGDKAKQERMAADQFAGFLLVNTRARVEFCRELGVDVEPFKTAFEKAHSREISRATAIHARDRWDASKIYEPLKAQMRKVIEVDMGDVAKSIGGDSAAACGLFREHATEVVGEMHLSKMQPAVHRALMQP